MRDETEDPPWGSLDQESLLDLLFGAGIAPSDGASTPSPLRSPDAPPPANVDSDPADVDSDPADSDDPESN